MFKTKNPYVQPARALYAAAVEQSRNSAFFTDYGVPDTIDGRFDLLLVHLFLLMHRCVAAGDTQLSQAVFDMTFTHMDQNLREAGIGDMGVPKHMRRMMKAFNGRMQVYETALAQGKLEQALERNLYGSLENKAPGMLSRMAEYIRLSAAFIAEQDFASLQAGQVEFLTPQKQKKYGT